MSLILFQSRALGQEDNDKNDPDSSSSMATIYVYRTGQFLAAARNWAIFVNGERICKLSNNKFLIHEVEPGNIAIAAQVGGVEFWPKKVKVFEIPVESGVKYYLKTNLKQSFTRGRVELSEVTERTFKEETKESAQDRCVDTEQSLNN